MTLPISAEYLAGFFDGDGCVAVYKNGRGTSHSLQVQITQNKSPRVSELMLMLTTHFGGCCTSFVSRSKRQAYIWQASGQKALAFLEMIRPHVRTKLPQLELAVNWYQNRPEPKRNSRGHIEKIDPVVLAEGERIRYQLMKMKTST